MYIRMMVILVLCIGAAAFLFFVEPSGMFVDFVSAAMAVGGTWLLIRFVLLTRAFIKAPKGVWERNRRARRLCRKINKGKEALSVGEEEEYQTFLRYGIIQRGLAVDRKTNEFRSRIWISQDALSDVL